MATDMTADAQKGTARNNSRSGESNQGGFFSSKFFLGLIAIILVLLTAGAGGFWYLTTNSPLTLLATGGDRSIAAATAFIPDRSPFTVSLLTKPEKLISLQQALISPEKQQQALEEVEEIKQNLASSTGLDYDRDIQPWIGHEITFAFTEPDLDLDSSNGAQPGYLLAIEIAGDRTQQAREFLQVFWQRQSLAGNAPISEQIRGVRVLHSDTARNSTGNPSAQLTNASALVGNQFVIFANDLRALKRSIQSAQTATNLAQNKAFRQAADQLNEPRLGLAYVNTTALGTVGSNVSQPKSRDRSAETTVSPNFAAIGLGITDTGLIANAHLSNTANQKANRSATPQEPSIDALKFIPANSAVALASRNLSQLAPTLRSTGMSGSMLPDFLDITPQTKGFSFNKRKTRTSDPDPLTALGSELWQWASGDYALGQAHVGNDDDWILAVERTEKGIQQLDDAARAQGYSTVPVTLSEALDEEALNEEANGEANDNPEAVAWTRLSIQGNRQSNGRSRGTQSARGLETEILALHLQQTSQQTDYEIFASSFSALESALGSSKATTQKSLLTDKRFTQAVDALKTPNKGYFYADWSAIAPTLRQSLPILKILETNLRPLMAHISTIAATQTGDTASLSVQLTRPTAQRTGSPYTRNISPQNVSQQRSRR
ncbi:MAG: DUF3352 domain-containing protein [Cyanobacteria bacterium P01_F01_bin.53]